jgi:hypothetical protein
MLSSILENEQWKQKLQATTNYNGVIALEKYSELKQLILEKIAQEEDTE